MCNTLYCLKVIKENFFSFLFQNNKEINDLLMTVRAIDQDFGKNGQISYYIKVNNENKLETEQFLIDEQSGELRSKIVFDREVEKKYKVFF